MSDPATFPRLANAGRPPDPPDMEMRMQALEAHQTEFRTAVMRMEGAIAAMDGKLDRFGDKLDRVALEVAELKGRVSQLPTTIMMISFTLAVLAGAGILKYYVR